MLKTLATFILRGQSQAILVTVAFAVLALMLPPLSILSGATVALVTLRLGAQPGVVLMALSTLLVGLLSYFTLGNPAPALMFFTALWLPNWLVGWVLRSSRSLALSLATAGGLGLLGVVVVYLVLGDAGDVSNWWQAVLQQVFAPVLSAANSEQQLILTEGIARASQIMTGLMAAGMLLNIVACLFLARGWQATLFNPGGFRTEFHGLRFSRGMALLALALLVLAVLQIGTPSSLATDLLLVLASLYLLQGMAVAHAIVARRRLHKAWLVGLYIVVFFLLPQLMLVVAGAGLIDTWADFRHRLATRGEGAG